MPQNQTNVITLKFASDPPRGVYDYADLKVDFTREPFWWESLLIACRLMKPLKQDTLTVRLDSLQWWQVKKNNFINVKEIRIVKF